MFGSATTVEVQNGCGAQSLDKWVQSCTQSRWMTKPGSAMSSSYEIAASVHLQQKWWMMVLFLRKWSMECLLLRGPSGRMCHLWLWCPLESVTPLSLKVSDRFQNLSWLLPAAVELSKHPPDWKTMFVAKDNCTVVTVLTVPAFYQRDFVLCSWTLFYFCFVC